MAEALLALGGNVGNSRAILDRAIALLCDGKEIRLIARSSDYRTPPWGFKYQPHFINLASRSRPHSARTNCWRAHKRSNAARARPRP